MATLHMLSHSPFADERLASSIRLLGIGDGLLLTGDATYALQPGTAPLQSLEMLPEGVSLYALAEDLDARQIGAPVHVQCLDYPAFVALCCQYDKVNTWL